MEKTVRTLFILLASAAICLAEDNPFSKIQFQQLQFEVAGGKTIVLKKDGSVRWPKGSPSAGEQLFWDAVVVEKSVDVSKVKARVNNDSEDNTEYTLSKAVDDWNSLVVTLKSSGKPRVDDTTQARALWKTLKKLFPHVFQ